MVRQLILSLVLLTNTSVPQSAPLISLRADTSLARTSFAQKARLNPSGFDPTYKLEFRNPVQDKNFYLLSLFQRRPEVGRILRRNSVLRRISNQRIQALRLAAKCDDVNCFDRLF